MCTNWLQELFSTFAFPIDLWKVGTSCISRKGGILERGGGMTPLTNYATVKNDDLLSWNCLIVFSSYQATVSWKFGHCYFLLIFFMHYVVIINYFGKILFPIKRKWGKQLLQASNFVCFYSCCFQIIIRTKRKGK